MSYPPVPQPCIGNCAPDAFSYAWIRNNGLGGGDHRGLDLRKTFGKSGSEQTKRSCDTDRPIQADRSEPADGLFAADNISRDVLCTKQQSADRR